LFLAESCSRVFSPLHEHSVFIFQILGGIGTFASLRHIGRACLNNLDGYGISDCEVLPYPVDVFADGTDKAAHRLDAQHILHLLLKDDFPKIWVPSWENRDVRQLLWHRHRMVQTRTRIMNQLQAAALNEGLRYKKKLWREAGRQQLESLPLAPWASRRRHDLLEVLDRINPTIAELTHAIEQEAEKCPEAQRLMTHPGVGALTALAFVLIIGEAERFGCGKQVASYLGLVPEEDSSGERRRLGHISKQGNSLLRFLLVEAAQVTVRCDVRWRNRYFHLAQRRGRKIAKGWGFVCTGCGAEDGITSNWKASVRTRDSLEILMV
jgi:transposase